MFWERCIIFLYYFHWGIRFSTALIPLLLSQNALPLSIVICILPSPDDSLSLGIFSTPSIYLPCQNTLLPGHLHHQFKTEVTFLFSSTSLRFSVYSHFLDDHISLQNFCLASPSPQNLFQEWIKPSILSLIRLWNPNFPIDSFPNKKKSKKKLSLSINVKLSWLTFI